MTKKLIALGCVVASLGFLAPMTMAADDQPKDPPANPAAAKDAGPGDAQQEWGQPGPPPDGQRGEMPPGQAGRGRGERRGEGDRRGEGHGPMGGHGFGHPGDDADMRGGRQMPPGMGGPMGGGMAPPMSGRPGPFGDWASFEKRDPELFKLLKQEMALERQTRELIRDYRDADAAKREEIKKEVDKLVDQQFDLRQQRRQLDLKRLTDELQRLKDAIDRRTQARKQIVEKRVAELLGQDNDPGF